MDKNHKAPEAGQLPKAWTRGRKETELPKSEWRKESSWTVQYEMKGVLGQVFAGAAGGILNFANPEEIRT